MMTILKASGEMVPHVDADGPPDLGRVKEVVGGWIEIVNIYWMGEPAQMIVDEEGRMKSKPLNPIGTGLYGAMALINKTSTEPLPEPIVGDVVLLTGKHMMD
jgi:hypothetical protein